MCCLGAEQFLCLLGRLAPELGNPPPVQFYPRLCISAPRRLLPGEGLGLSPRGGGAVSDTP